MIDGLLTHTLTHWVGTGDLYGVFRAHRQKPPTDIAPTVQMHAHVFICHQALVYRNAWSENICRRSSLRQLTHLKTCLPGLNKYIYFCFVMRLLVSAIMRLHDTTNPPAPSPTTRPKTEPGYYGCVCRVHPAVLLLSGKLTQTRRRAACEGQRQAIFGRGMRGMAKQPRKTQRGSWP